MNAKTTSVTSDNLRGTVPIAVVMISLNEAHNMEAVLDNIEGWAQEIHLVDSFSSDETVDIAVSRGVNVVQKPFKGFGDQWDFAVNKLEIQAPWTMKLDPDEIITPDLKQAIEEEITADKYDGMILVRRKWFMGKPLTIDDRVLRVWRTGSCRFPSVRVNEHPIVTGELIELAGDLEHHDSPDLHHWFDKQNHYSTAEAISASSGEMMAAEPRFFGNNLERRMWFKRLATHTPFAATAMFFYTWLWKGTWRAGRVGFIAARLSGDKWRFRYYKRYEIELTGRVPNVRNSSIGARDNRVPQYD